MFSEKWKKEIFTLPNLLSFFRIALIPVYLSVYRRAASQGQYLLAGAILSVSCMTDMIDGMIARKFDMVTDVGKVLDPLADKLTQFSLIFSLSGRYSALIPVLILFLVKEVFQLTAVIVNLYQGKVLPGALTAGKICTAVLFVSFISLVMFPHMPQLLVDSIALVNSLFLTISFVSYILAYYGKHKKVEDFHAE